LKGKGVMSPEEADNLLVKEILPQQVWETLKTVQQQAVLQTMVQLCHQVAVLLEGEENDESTPNR
jgi:hypothetical protein